MSTCDAQVCHCELAEDTSYRNCWITQLRTVHRVLLSRSFDNFLPVLMILPSLMPRTLDFSYASVLAKRRYRPLLVLNFGFLPINMPVVLTDKNHELCVSAWNSSTREVFYKFSLTCSSGLTLHIIFI
jgi:hypothetical protein